MHQDNQNRIVKVWNLKKKLLKMQIASPSLSLYFKVIRNALAKCIASGTNLG